MRRRGLVDCTIHEVAAQPACGTPTLATGCQPLRGHDDAACGRVQASCRTGYFLLSLRRLAAASSRARSSAVRTGTPPGGRGITRPSRPAISDRLAILAMVSFIEQLGQSFVLSTLAVFDRSRHPNGTTATGRPQIPPSGQKRGQRIEAFSNVSPRFQVSRPPTIHRLIDASTLASTIICSRRQSDRTLSAVLRASVTWSSCPPPNWCPRRRSPSRIQLT